MHRPFHRAAPRGNLGSARGVHKASTEGDGGAPSPGPSPQGGGEHDDGAPHPTTTAWTVSKEIPLPRHGGGWRLSGRRVGAPADASAGPA